MGGELRNAKRGDRSAFPGAAFVAQGTIPLDQCTDAIISNENATIQGGPPAIIDPGAFAGFSLVGKFATITAGPDPVPQTREIASHNDNAIEFDAPPFFYNGPGAYFVHNGGSLEKQQTDEEIMNESHSLGSATMRKGGQVFIDGEVTQVKPACPIIFDPK